MAAQQHGTDDFDMDQHVRTWNAFTRLMQVAIVGAAITLLLMAYFLT